MSLKHLKSFFSLLPPGLFNFHRSENLKKLITPVARELQTVEDFIKGLYDNIFPQNSNATFLIKWGNFTNQKLSTFDIGRANILRQLKKSGGATVESFVSHLKDLGIDDNNEERVIKRIDPFTCNSTCNDRIWGAGIATIFALRLPRDPQYFTCNSRCDAALVENQSREVLQYLRSCAPAHTQLIFFYDGLN